MRKSAGTSTGGLMLRLYCNKSEDLKSTYIM